jgi:hypothetical protein
MRIIKKGKVPFKEKRFECGNCGCEFLADENDRKSDQRDETMLCVPLVASLFLGNYGNNYKERFA